MWVFDAYLLLLAFAGARWLITVAGEQRRRRS
jgi:hypothetical protein